MVIVHLLASEWGSFKGVKWMSFSLRSSIAIRVSCSQKHWAVDALVFLVNSFFEVVLSLVLYPVGFFFFFFYFKMLFSSCELPVLFLSLVSLCANYIALKNKIKKCFLYMPYQFLPSLTLCLYYVSFLWLVFKVSIERLKNTLFSLLFRSVASIWRVRALPLSTAFRLSRISVVSIRRCALYRWNLHFVRQPRCADPYGWGIFIIIIIFAHAAPLFFSPIFNEGIVKSAWSSIHTCSYAAACAFASVLFYGFADGSSKKKR